MKKTTLSLIIFLTSFYSFSQSNVVQPEELVKKFKPSSQLYLQWNTTKNDWDTIEKKLFFYDGSMGLEEEIWQTYASAQFTNATKFHYYINSNSCVDSTSGYQWDGINSVWIYGSKTTNSFYSPCKIDSTFSVISLFGPSVKYVERKYTYNGAMSILTDVTHSFDVFSGLPAVTDSIVYTRNVNEDILSSDRVYISFDPYIHIDKSRKTNKYNANDWLESTLTEQWDSASSSYIPERFDSMVYDINGRAIKHLLKWWNADSLRLINYSKDSIINDVNGNDILHIWQGWDWMYGGYLMPGSKDSCFFDSNSNIVSSQSYIFIGDTAWLPSNSKYEYSYSSSNQVEVYSISNYNNDSLKYLPSEKYIYDYAVVQSVAANVDITKTIEVFPNPAEDVIKVSITNAEQNTSLSIYSIEGKNVHTTFIASGNNNTLIDISTLESGLYFIKIESSSAIHTCKFVKQ